MNALSNVYGWDSTEGEDEDEASLGEIVEGLQTSVGQHLQGDLPLSNEALALGMVNVREFEFMEYINNFENKSIHIHLVCQGEFSRRYLM